MAHILFNGRRLDLIEALSMIMEDGGITYRELARRCDVKELAMGRRFQRRSDVPVSTAARMADALGYQLALVPKSADLPREAAVIAVEDEDRHLRT